MSEQQKRQSWSGGVQHATMSAEQKRQSWTAGTNVPVMGKLILPSRNTTCFPHKPVEVERSGVKNMIAGRMAPTLVLPPGSPTQYHYYSEVDESQISPTPTSPNSSGYEIPVTPPFVAPLPPVDPSRVRQQDPVYQNVKPSGRIEDHQPPIIPQKPRPPDVPDRTYQNLPAKPRPPDVPGRTYPNLPPKPRPPDVPGRTYPNLPPKPRPPDVPGRTYQNLPPKPRAPDVPDRSYQNLAPSFPEKPRQSDPQDSTYQNLPPSVPTRPRQPHRPDSTYQNLPSSVPSRPRPPDPQDSTYQNLPSSVPSRPRPPDPQDRTYQNETPAYPPAGQTDSQSCVYQNEPENVYQNATPEPPPRRKPERENIYDNVPQQFQESDYQNPPLRPANPQMPSSYQRPPPRPPRLTANLSVGQKQPVILANLKTSGVHHHTSAALATEQKSSSTMLDPLIPSSNIARLSQSTFKDFLSARDAALVMFYHSTHSKLQQYKHLFDQASRSTSRDNPAFASVDCSSERDLCVHEHVFSYPVIKVYNKGVTVKSLQGEALLSPPLIDQNLNYTSQR